VSQSLPPLFFSRLCAIHERGSEGRGCACKQLEAFICVVAIIIGYRGLSCVKTLAIAVNVYGSLLVWKPLGTSKWNERASILRELYKIETRDSTITKISRGRITRRDGRPSVLVNN
jgi:hypothetical protein